MENRGEKMSGKLFVVGTPLGNLGDFSPRAIETLNQVDFIAAEDTRVTLKLLNRFEIKKPMISYYEHNLVQKSDIIIERIANGESCALVSDAGMPCISDPGEILVKLATEQNIEVIVIPGPSAVISALAISGLITSRFCFEGFLSTNKRNRKEHLKEIENEERTIVFYEAPHKLLATLKELLTVLGDRKISLARELTKIHEEVIRTTISQAIKKYETTSPRGEFVLIIEGKEKKEQEQLTIDEALELANNLVSQGTKISEAAKQIAKQTGFSKSEIYKKMMDGK
jgi:16S rRNA (cytidine1402-2'-O)-methyltransferase